MSTKYKSKRPIEKDIINVHLTSAGTQQEAVIYTADDPCTVSGLRGNLMVTGTVTPDTFRFVIVRVPANLGASTLGTTSGGFLYRPENEVLFSFAGRLYNVGDFINVPIDIKAMRKLRETDSIRVEFVSGGTSKLDGCINIFSKH